MRKKINCIKKVIAFVMCSVLLASTVLPTSMSAKAADGEYQELTFKDWGLDDQTATDGNNTPWSSKTPITSWENVAISGELTYRESTTLTYWGFGANTYKDGDWYGLRIRQDGYGNLIIEDYGNQVSSFDWKSLGSYTTGTTVAIRVTFTKLSSGNVELGVSVNGGTPVTAEITATELSAMKLGMMVRASDGTAITIKSTAEQIIEYQELTFRDWGLNDQTATDGNNTPWSSKTPITSWENVAISGELTYRESTTLTYWGFGANTYKDGDWYGLRIRQDGYGNLIIEDYGNQVSSFDWKSLGSYTTGTTVAIRVTFTKLSSGNVELGVSVNGGTPVTAEITATELSAMKLGMMVRASDGTAITIKSTAEQIIEYQELTFRDWGLNDQTATNGNNTVWCKKIPITSWENVAISGDISFGVNNVNSSWRFGTNNVQDGSWHGFCIRQDGSGNLVIEDIGGKSAALSWKTLGKYTVGTTIPIRVTFTTLETGNVELAVSVNSGDAVIIELTESEMANLGLGMMIRASDGTSITITSTPEPVYQELTLSDWGLKNQKVKGAATVWSSKTPIASWENVAVNAEIAFAADETNSYWRIGSGTTSDGSWAGLSIRPDGSGNLVVEKASVDLGSFSWKTLGSFTVGAAIPIRITFTKLLTGNVELGIAINDSAPVKATISADNLSNLGFGMYVNAVSGNTVTIASTPIGEVEYKELTFRDWGLTAGSVGNTSDSETVWSLGSPITSWDNVAISGYLTFTDNDSNTENSYIRIGVNKETNSWYGLQIRSAGNQIAIEDQCNPGIGELNWKLVGSTSNGAEVPFRITFTRTGINLEVELTINNSASTSFKVTNEEAEGLSFDILMRTAKGDSITYKSSELEKDVKDVSYNIEKDPYVLTSATSVTVDGNAATIGDTISEAGDYIIKTNQNNVRTERTVSLYIVGDVDLDSSTGTTIILDVDDVAALKEILAGATATAAQQKAADLNNDGKLTNDDLKLLQDIVAGKKTRDAVLDKYYTDVLFYDYLGGDEVMPIAGYYGADASHLTDEVFQAIKDAGINLINYSPINYWTNPSAVLQSLKLAEEKGIGMYVDDGLLNPLTYDSNGNVTTEPNTQLRTDKEVAKYLGNYSYYDSFLGNYVKDEPTVAGMKDLQISATSKANYQFYTKISQQLNKYTNSLGYINNAAAWWFHKGWSSNNTGNNTSYDYEICDKSIAEYQSIIKTITEETDARVLSYDRYLTDTKEDYQECYRYMLNLDMIRSQAQTSEIPFWAYVPVGGNWDGSNSSLIPSEAEVYWQANISLAFGAKGLQYYSLVQQPEIYEASGSLTSCGILDANYNKNTSSGRAWYTYAQNVNKQVKAVDEILMKADNLGVFAVGTYATKNTASIEVYNGSSAYKKSLSSLITYADMKSTDGVQRVKEISGNNVLAGVFDYQGKVALYVVNWNTNSASDITVKFTNDSKYRVISANEDSTGLAGSITRNVKAGEAFLIVIEEEDLETTAQYFDNIASYRGDVYTAPELEGYVFAGWYTSEDVAMTDYDYTSANGANATEKAGTLPATTKTGAAWAKYVDASVLSVKAQIRPGTTADTDKTDLRLVTTTNSLVYDKIGFDVSTQKGSLSKESSTVYRKIKANANGVEFNYQPTVFHNSSAFFATITITGLKVKGNTDAPITIKPFWKTQDGTTVYGETRVLTLAEGI